MAARNMETAPPNELTENQKSLIESLKCVARLIAEQIAADEARIKALSKRIETQTELLEKLNSENFGSRFCSRAASEPTTDLRLPGSTP